MEEFGTDDAFRRVVVLYCDVIAGLPRDVAVDVEG
jgi:hypothetical protein